jgi:16S rRNA (guanine527-N7)-methyltransferase
MHSEVDRSVNTAPLDPSIADALDELLLSAGHAVSTPQREALLGYLALLTKWNKTYNLTAVRDPGQMVGIHLLDSLSVLQTLDRLKVDRLCDVGSGAGLPGIPIAITRPNCDVTMVDCVEKKTTFIRQCIAELQLRNASVEATRIEDFHPARPYAAIISRAYAELRNFVDSVRELFLPGTRLLAMKGADPRAEILRLPADVVVSEVIALTVPSLGAARHLVVLERRVS